ncbi:type I polyketide synthase [Paludisphaera mucosa]|uniref:SDR family NAD(P)-dependent oxidoreductase n=1 Tax=Paludisphaera mucosa TaxID=3030827 RepID=A0ABT6FL99_9BACT|nr:type I polyketide synthase [Paludisphaera mucosa]MDG3008355.1 SDR family NAD(P)-dependent oxidoreductase [Paludisphaera mucosa]
MSTKRIAIIGMACEFADAPSPQALWENALARRRAFRRLPRERLDLDAYFVEGLDAPDHTCATEAAVIRDYEFDRVRFRVSGEAFRAADPVHWLALDVADRALVDAGFPDGADLPREQTGVYLGNTLTGETSRAQALRLRWPYVRRTIASALTSEGWPPDRRRKFLDELEVRYKAPFPPVGPETLSGGLSNTIAGRICNHFGFNGGGSTVDAACASSLLAVVHACTALSVGDLDVALAGGVDVSLDPFELVGFAKAGALTSGEMRVFDARSDGFWPGEGCGVVVLMRWEDALAQGKRIRCTLPGWGVSSDGHGGLTRPEVEGQVLALRRAYRRAGFGIDSVAYFEGHGTGTAVGDATELRALGRARREADREVVSGPTAVGSVKANIGHTKAAAGVAGLIKAVMALDVQVIPPATSCDIPHPELTAPTAALRAPTDGEPWPADLPFRAGVSAMGFGGINVHVVLENLEAQRRRSLTPEQSRLLRSPQDAELFVFEEDSAGALRAWIEDFHRLAPGLSRSELTDAAGTLAFRLGPRRKPYRAAVVASTPAELVKRLEVLRLRLDDGPGTRLDVRNGVFVGEGCETPRVGFLFPGQGSPVYRAPDSWARRFPAVRRAYETADLPEVRDGRSTDVAQPAILAAAIAGLAVLDEVGLVAEVGVGHSVGELSALYWGGCIDATTLMRLAKARGRAMAGCVAGGDAGAMASLGADRTWAETLIDGEPVVVAALNSPRQTVVSGPTCAVARVVERARLAGVAATILGVSRAFHSPLVADAMTPLAEAIGRERLAPPRKAVVSTVTGALLERDADLASILCRQVTAPIRFVEAFSACEGIDLWVEVGPGDVLGGLAAESGASHVVSLDVGGASFRGLLGAVAAAFAAGCAVRPGVLFEDRFLRPLDLGATPRFFTNPCESISPSDPLESPRGATAERVEVPGSRQDLEAPTIGVSVQGRAVDVVRRLVAERTELPVEEVGDDHRLLRDLHLNSIAVSQLVVEAARRLGMPAPVLPTRFANVTVAEAAAALEESAWGGTKASDAPSAALGLGDWVRPFTVEWVEKTRPPRSASADGDVSWHIVAPTGDGIAQELGRTLGRAGGPGVAVVLPDEAESSWLELLLEGARAALKLATDGRFLVVGSGGVGAAFAKSVHLEAPWLDTAAVVVPLSHPDAAAWVVAEAPTGRGFVEVRYDSSGHRFEPSLRPLGPLGSPPARHSLGSEDVVLVTGGGKGVAAECALELARRTGVRLGLMGRARPEDDPDLAANLQRIRAAGVDCQYASADVTHADEVRRAVATVEAGLGPITAVVHAAGVNEPRPLVELDLELLQRTSAPKVQGLRNVLDAVSSRRIHLLVTFGSIIARTGMRGEAHYALANAWQTELTGRFQAEHPACYCLALEWSVWASVGMGERLGRIEALTREGVGPIPTETGAALFTALVAKRPPHASVVVAGRIGDSPTLSLARPPLPALRFLDRLLIDYPGIELVAETDLSRKADPYLDDHVFQGERLLPAVIGLEAMAQAVAGVMRGQGPMPTIIEEVAFERPIIIDDAGSTTVRLVALVREGGVVEVALRCHATGYHLDHFRATFRSGPEHPWAAGIHDPGAGEAVDRLSLDPERELYGALLFQGGRFRRLRSYDRLTAKACRAEVAPSDRRNWFGDRPEEEPILGDPGARDAAVHCVQACIPHVSVLPVGVRRIIADPVWRKGPRRVVADERSCDDGVFTYDLTIFDANATPVERWEGLRLKVIGSTHNIGRWPAVLLAPYLERRASELAPGLEVAFAVETGEAADRRSRTDRAMARAFGDATPVRRRPDGKPDAFKGLHSSAAHAGMLTLAAVGRWPLGCDVEPARARPVDDWLGVLGEHRLGLARRLADEAGGGLDAAAARVWAASESLQKLGSIDPDTLVHETTDSGGWETFRAGGATVLAHVLPVAGEPDLIAVALAVRPPQLNGLHADEGGRRRTYEYRHVIGLEESNLLGNIYFVNHLRWQGRCREMFLRDHAPAVLAALERDIALVTTNVSCDFLSELKPFDEVAVRMSLESLGTYSIAFHFDYWRVSSDGELLVACGRQSVACLRRGPAGPTPSPIPEALRTALAEFS